MEPNLTEFEQEPVQRPTLLTVLCILTFIGSTWAIITSAYSYSTASKTVKAFSEVNIKRQNDSLENSNTGERRKNPSQVGKKIMFSLSTMMTEDNIRKSAIGTIISALFTLCGAWLMWRLRRTGLYLYITGIIIGLIVPFYLFGNNLMAVGMSSVSTFFGLVFIALYSLNIKNMH